MSILDDAKQLTTTDRRDVYGHPTVDFARIAALWSVILRIPVSARQVGICMIALKLARETNAHARDTLVDIAGYAACLQTIADLEDPCSVPDAAPSSSTTEATSPVPLVIPSVLAAVKDASEMLKEICPKCQRFLLPKPHRCDP